MKDFSELVFIKAEKLFPLPISEKVITKMELVGFPINKRNARICVAILHLSEGNYEKFNIALDLAVQDWRDVLVAAKLANEDWEEKLEKELIQYNVL